MIKNRIYYVAVLIITVVLNWLFRNQQTLVMLICVAVLPVISAVLAGISARFIRITQGLDRESAFKGAAVKYYMEVQNRSVLPCPYIRLRFFKENAVFFDMGDTAQLSLLPYGCRSAEIALPCKYRGIYPVGIENVEIRDWLGMVRFPMKPVQPCVLSVFPRVLNISGLLEGEPELYSPFTEQDYTVIQDHREWLPSDSMKHIHWKLSAKSDKMIIKKFAGVTSVTDAVIIDTCRQTDEAQPDLFVIEAEDRLIEGAIAVLYDRTAKGRPSDLVDTPESAIKDETDASDFEYFYERLALMQFHGSDELSSKLYDYLQRRSTVQHLWIFTFSLTGALFDAILSALDQGNAVSTFIISGSAFPFGSVADDVSRVTMLKNAGADVTVIPPERDIYSVLKQAAVL